MSDLIDKHKMFVQEYIVDFNGTRAYMAVYPDSSYDSARTDACRLLANANIQEAIAREQDEKIKRVQITQDEVLRDLIEVRDRCLQKEPVKFYNKHTKEWEETGEWQFREHGVLKACELLGKHLKMFTDKVESKNENENKNINTAVKLSEEEEERLAKEIGLISND